MVTLLMAIVRGRFISVNPRSSALVECDTLNGFRRVSERNGCGQQDEETNL